MRNTVEITIPGISYGGVRYALEPGMQLQNQRDMIRNVDNAELGIRSPW